MPRHLHSFLILACLTGCSLAGASDDVALHVQPHGFGTELDYEPGALWANSHASCVQAQLDAEAMLADVREAHDAEATRVLRERER